MICPQSLDLSPRHPPEFFLCIQLYVLVPPTTRSIAEPWKSPCQPHPCCPAPSCPCEAGGLARCWRLALLPGKVWPPHRWLLATFNLILNISLVAPQAKSSSDGAQQGPRFHLPSHRKPKKKASKAQVCVPVSTWYSPFPGCRRHSDKGHPRVSI